MKALLTIDSSIFIAALRPAESFYDHCSRLLGQVVEGEYEVFVPYSVLVEVVAAAFRRTKSRQFANTVQAQLLQIPSLHFLDLVKSRATQACELAVASGLRGMDALVLQVAQEMQATLVTLDDELLKSVRGLIPAKSIEALVR